MDRLKLPGFAALSVLLAFVAVPVQADTGGWSVAGPLPPGGFVGKVVVDPAAPSILYAAAQQGVYESTDSGATWTRVFKTLNPPKDIAIDPQDPSTLYVVSTDEEGGFYKSTDGGATWAQMDDGILGSGAFVIDQLVQVAVDPVDEGVVYVGGNNTGVYKSTDGGAHWTQSSTGIVTVSTVYAQVLSLAVDPVTPAVVYAFVESYDGSSTTTCLYKSADGGASWTVLSSTPYFLFPVDVEIDPADHTHLIASFGNSIDASHDSGALFTALYTSEYLQTLAIDPSDSNHILVGSNTSLYASSDGISFASDPNVPSNGIGGIAFDPVTPSNIYLGSTAWGVLKSGDGGSTWSQSSTGIPDLSVERLLEGSDGILYMSTGQSGIYKSLDQGATWGQVGTGFAGSLPSAEDAVDAFAQDPTAPAKLYVGGAAGLYRSADGGASWTASNTGMPSEASVRFLAVDPEAPATLYAGLSWYASSSQAGIYKSVDGGATWAAATSGLTFPVVPLVNAIAVDPEQSSVIYAAPYQDGLFKSVDGGASWTESDTGMGKVDIFSLAVDPTDSDIVYASAIEGFYKSGDGGATWAASGTGMSGEQIFDALLIDPVDPSILYLSAPYWGGESYVSTDGAATWQPLDGGALAAASVSLGSTLIDPSHPTRIYAAGSDGMLHVFDHAEPPVALQALDGAVSTTLNVGVPGTLDFTYAPQGASFEFVLVAKPGHGKVVLTDAVAGAFSYTPSKGYLGPDSFSFELKLSTGAVSDVATESVLVTALAPVALDGKLRISPYLPVKGTLKAVKSYTGQVLTYSVVSPPAHGSVKLTDASTGAFIYRAVPGVRGSDSFTFKVVDQWGTSSNVATVSVTRN